MIICHVCGAECTDGTELCPICGAELQAAEEYTEKPVEIIIEHPVLAASVEDVVTGEIYRDVLKENGILFTFDEPDEETSMKIVFGGGFVAQDIYVDEKDLAEAQRLYEEILNAEPEFTDFEDMESENTDDGFGESNLNDK